MKIFKQCIYFFFTAAASFTLLIPQAASSAEPEVIDRIVAVVNDDIISLFELNRLVVPYKKRIKEMGYPPEKESVMLYKVRDDVLSKLIEQKLTAQETRRARISISDKEIDDAVERVKAKSGMSESELETMLTKEGFTMQEYRNRIKDQILQSRLMNQEVKSKIVITDEDVAAYYDAHPEEYKNVKKYRLRNILLEVSSFVSEMEKENIRKKMEGIVSQIRGGADFAETARKYSEASVAEEGGDLGFFEYDEMAPMIQAVLKGRKAGEMTPILDTPQGFQVFYIESIEEVPGRPLEEAYAEIEEKLYQERMEQKFKTWLSEIRERSAIRVIE